MTDTTTAQAGEARTEVMEERTMAATAAKTKAKKPTKAKAKKPTKAKAKKPVKAKAKKPTKPKKKKPTTGQSGPPQDVTFTDLNDKEKEVVALLNGKGKGARNPLKIADIAKHCFMKQVKESAQANSWTRNSLRRLVCSGWVEKAVESGSPVRGLYRITDKGRKRLQRS